MRKLNHIGIPTTEKQPGETYLPDLKVYITDYAKSPNKIEFLRFEEGSPMDEKIQKLAHIAYEVPDLEEAMKGKKVLCEPFGDEKLRCAFIEEEGIALELMCFGK